MDKRVKPYKCKECGEERPEKFTSRYKGICAKCQQEYYKRWYAKNGRRRADNYQDIVVLWNKNHQKEIQIKRMVAKAIKQGLLERSLECAICGRDRCRINAHHNDYDLPFDVMWLCSSCHKKLHLQKPP